MARWSKENRGYAGPGKGQGKSSLPIDVPRRYEEGFLEEMDGRGEVVKLLRQRLAQLTGDLGGLDGLSYQERSLCKRIIHLERQLDKKELSLAHDTPIDESSYYNAINALSGLFAKIGLKRRAKLVNSLSAVLNAAKQPEPQPAPQPKKEKPS